jgi:hypothetical protein
MSAKMNHSGQCDMLNRIDGPHAVHMQHVLAYYISSTACMVEGAGKGSGHSVLVHHDPSLKPTLKGMSIPSGIDLSLSISLWREGTCQVVEINEAKHVKTGRRHVCIERRRRHSGSRGE